MNVNPLDLQVLFSKAADIAGNLGKESAMQEAALFGAEQELIQEGKNAQDTITQTTDVEEGFSPLNPDSKQREKPDQETEFEENEEDRESLLQSDESIHLKGRGQGKIIDLYD